ncbi:non-heme iron oxygenase ferredoxin subunit [Spirochaetia bacterium 38H-sp]|uniref:Non-heme iron oxygenase ferredoxin subunit n=1 Tax=Rarispira pelagica TaxID=3141764 RepID=A0ABU9UDL1_9SPIR
MAKWYKTIKADSFDKSTGVMCGKNKIALFKLDGEVFALDDVCSHEYSLLSEGMVWKEHVYCPKHGSRFDIKTGRVLDFPATKNVKKYDVKIEDGYVYVKV